VAFCLMTDIITPMFASSSLPLPNDPTTQVRSWFSENQLAAVLMGASQVLSVSSLAAFVHTAGGPRSRPWGFAAVACMLVSSACAWVLAGVAAASSLSTVDALRSVNFVAGGTAHVLALGVFVLIASRAAPFGRPLRVLARVAVVVCALSVSSLLVFEGAAFILLGRLLCMVWTVSAGVAILRRVRRAAR
jgi:hypothetical protein